MGLLPPFKRLLSEDFQSQASWINNLLIPLNQLITTVYSNFNNGLTIQQNLLGQVKTLTITGASPTTSFPYTFSSVQPPVGVFMGQCLATDGSIVSTSVSLAWSYASGTITINNITGLSSSKSYTCTFLIFGG